MEQRILESHFVKVKKSVFFLIWGFNFYILFLLLLLLTMWHSNGTDVIGFE